MKLFGSERTFRYDCESWFLWCTDRKEMYDSGKFHQWMHSVHKWCAEGGYGKIQLEFVSPNPYEKIKECTSWMVLSRKRNLWENAIINLIKLY